MTAKKTVIIYVFELDDGKTTDERLAVAAKRYCRVNNLQMECESGKAVFRVERTERGKPYFPELQEVKVSVSHSGKYWVCACSDEEVGIDLQEHVRMQGESIEEATVRFRRMAHRFFHPVEAKFVDGDSYARFFGVWAARESFVKYTGQGIDAVFSEHCVIPVKESEWPRMNGEEGIETWSAQGSYFSETRYRENYTLCVCTRERCRIEFADHREIMIDNQVIV